MIAIRRGLSATGPARRGLAWAGWFLTVTLGNPLEWIGKRMAWPAMAFAGELLMGFLTLAFQLLAVWLVTLGLWWIGFGSAAFMRGFIGGLHRGLPHAIDFTASHAPALVRVLERRGRDRGGPRARARGFLRAARLDA